MCENTPLRPNHTRGRSLHLLRFEMDSHSLLTTCTLTAAAYLPATPTCTLTPSQSVHESVDQETPAVLVPGRSGSEEVDDRGKIVKFATWQTRFVGEVLGFLPFLVSAVQCSALGSRLCLCFCRRSAWVSSVLGECSTVQCTRIALVLVLL